VTQLELELARTVTHDDAERVRANDAGGTVDAVQVGRLVNAVQQAEPVLEHAVANLELVKVGAQTDRDETTAAIVERTCALDDSARSAHCVVDDLPEPLVRDGLVCIRQRLASRLAVVRTTEVVVAFPLRSIVKVNVTLFDFVRERIPEVDDRNDLGHSMPRHLGSGLNVAINDFSRHSSEYLLSVGVDCRQSIPELLYGSNNFCRKVLIPKEAVFMPESNLLYKKNT